VATPKKVYLFDVLKGGERLFFDRGLRYLLESNKIIKIMHDCRKDSEALYFQYDVTLRGVWDSQIAYAVLSQLKGVRNLL
jgi:exonuclease 3'-5' domain-containing protein 1